MVKFVIGVHHDKTDFYRPGDCHYIFDVRWVASESMTNLIGPDVSFWQDKPDTLKKTDFPMMRSAGASFVIV